jgi:trans-aconitate 2-methyltransferase
LRLRPAFDLMAQIPPLPPGDVVDLGCGSGAAGEALRLQFCQDDTARELIGVDHARTMLEAAGKTRAYDRLSLSGIEDWVPLRPPALIFTNAVMHWLGDHARLLPRLVKQLAPGGTLAVQVPFQNDAPSHRLWPALLREMFPDHPKVTQPGILSAQTYHEMLSRYGSFSAWETTYYQVLEPSEDGHPVRNFTQSTYARPFLGGLTPDQQKRLVAAYDQRVNHDYPRVEDGSVLFPFQRLFMVLTLA